MKKVVVVLFLSLTLFRCFSNGGIAFAKDTADILNGVSSVKVNVFLANIKIIIIYGIFILSLLVGVPILKRMNKKNRTNNSEALSVLAKKEADRIDELLAKENKLSSKEILREAFYLNVLAEKVLSVYTTEQVDGYLDVYNNVLSVREKLLALEKKKGDSYNESIENIKKIMQSITLQVDFIIEREKKISQYNGWLW